jgi:invasion protein IalB
MKRAFLVLLLIAAYPALDRSTGKAADDPRATQLTYEPWAKSCIAKTCFVAAGARGACSPSGGVLSIITSDDKNVSLSANLATKQPLDGAINVQIDQHDPILVPNPKCYGLICGGKVDIDNEVIEQLRNSRTVTIDATTTAHGKISLSLSLAGFAEAYDGPGTEPRAVVETVTDEKMKELLKQAEEQKERQKALECKE